MKENGICLRWLPAGAFAQRGAADSFRHRWRDATSLSEGGSGEKENFAALPKAPSPRELSPQATEGVIKKHPQFSRCGCLAVY